MQVSCLPAVLITVLGEVVLLSTVINFRLNVAIPIVWPFLLPDYWIMSILFAGLIALLLLLLLCNTCGKDLQIIMLLIFCLSSCIIHIKCLSHNLHNYLAHKYS